jgi:hypothetical protein
MVIVMLKFIVPATVSATLALSAAIAVCSTSHAGPYEPSHAKPAAASPYQSSWGLAHRSKRGLQPEFGNNGVPAIRTPSGLLQIRDVSMSGGSGGNGCWNACFSDFDECMSIRTKTTCVSRVKTCLETCDRLSNRPGM